jgi:hypothetical protein
MIVGLDPGAFTGVAVFDGGKLWKMETIGPHQIADYLTKARPRRVIFEDSRLISHLFTTNKNTRVALNMARKVGQVDGYCNIIVSVCADLGIPAHGISPKDKGAKMDAARFGDVTGWEGKSNQHERDAAMVAWRFRSAKD